MIKIDLNLQKDYISGSKTSISKDVLENSSIFMKSLLKDTKDIKYYNNCSEDLKKDYDFVYFLISTFSTKRLFVEKVINNYIDNYDGKEDEFSIFSIAILGAKVLKDRYNATCERCMEICDKLYNRTMLSVFTKSRIREVSYLGSADHGFKDISYLYNDYDNIMQFFAYDYIINIFDHSKLDMEADLHRKFKNKKELEMYGVNNYLLNHIKSYDSSLFDYVVLNKGLLKELIDKVSKYVKVWDSYEEYIDQRKYAMLFEKVHTYMDDQDNMYAKLDELDIICYIASLDSTKQYLSHNFYRYVARSMIESLDVNYIRKIISSSVVDASNYFAIKKIFNDTIYDENDNEASIDNYLNVPFRRCKIIKVDFNIAKDVDKE